MSGFLQATQQVPVRVDVTAATILGALISAVAATVMLAYSWRRTRERWIAWLVVVWVLWVVRYTLGFLPIGIWPLADARPAVVLVARDAALVMALRELGVRWLAPVWGVAAIPVVLATIAGRTGAWYGWYLFELLAAAWLMAAVVVARSPRIWSRIRVPTALGMLLYAVLLGTTPWYGGAGPFVGFSIALATAVHLIVASGVAVGVRQRMHEEREAAEQRVARALEYVVRGVVPMCSYCRSVRDKHGEWVSLEDFVAEGTAGPVIDARCPDCASAVVPETSRG